MTTEIRGLADEYRTRLRPNAIPMRGVFPIGECVDCDGEVYLEDDEGIARCEGCGQGWRIGVVLLVERL